MSKTVVKDVCVMKEVDGKRKQVKVSEVEVVIYDTVEELTSNETPERILAMFNKANVIRLQGNERAKFKEGKASKTKRRSLAYNLLTQDELVQYAGDFDALQEYLDSEEMQARVDAEIDNG